MKFSYIFLMLMIISATASADQTAMLAKSHFDSIASGNVKNIMIQYSKNASLHWVGGPLDGQYSGQEQLSQVWGKFTNALGPMSVSVTNVVENKNPKGATVTADVLFTGKKTIPVRYVLSYRDNKLVNEIWQISPSLKNN